MKLFKYWQNCEEKGMFRSVQIHWVFLRATYWKWRATKISIASEWAISSLTKFVWWEKKKQREPLHPRAVFNAVLVSETVNSYLQPEGDGSERQLTEQSLGTCHRMLLIVFLRHSWWGHLLLLHCGTAHLTRNSMKEETPILVHC